MRAVVGVVRQINGEEPGPRRPSVRVCVVAAVLAVLGCGQSAPAAPSTARLVLLGTGTPNSDPARSGPAVAVIVGGESYLVDAGPGIVRRAAAAAERGVDGLHNSQLQRVFITHLHSDHTLGLPDLLLSPWTADDREAPLEVYGPPGIASMMEHLTAAYTVDIRLRLDGSQPANDTGHSNVVHEIRGIDESRPISEIYRDDNVSVDAFRVPHGSWDHAFGFRFRTADRTFVISGDTSPSEAIVEYCNGCDMLVHEVYSDAGFAARPPEWQRYHSSFHTSATELGGIAARARPRLLVLYHQLFWGTTESGLLEEVASRYDGATVSGQDLDVY